MRCEGGFHVYHTILFHHGTDGSDAGLMAVVGKGDGGNGDDGAFLESVQFVFKYIEADLQMLGIYNAEQRFARNGRRIKHGIELGHYARDGRQDGAVGQLMFQLAEGDLGGVILHIVPDPVCNRGLLFPTETFPVHHAVPAEVEGRYVVRNFAIGIITAFFGDKHAYTTVFQVGIE